MKEAREAHLLTASIKTSMEDAMAQKTSAASKVGYVSASLTQMVNPGTRQRLDTMYQALNT